MTVLVVSPDEDAARSLCSALGRSGQIAIWERATERALEVARDREPLVVVTDTCVGGYLEFLDEIRDSTPWTRIYLMADPSGALPQTTSPVVPKPFDAAQLAELLSREIELAALERGRRSLQAHAEELALLVEASFEAIIGLSDDGTILSWNRGAEAMYGFEAGEAVGRPISLLGDSQGLDAAALQRGSRQVRELTRRCKDGSEIIVLLSISPVARKTPSTLAFAEVSLDITARRKLERELEHAERLAAIGRLAASMAHEINNPLAVIRASTAYIAEVAERVRDEELADSAEDMNLAVERIGSFVQHVCGFARRERPQLEDASLSGTLDIALRMVRPRAVEKEVRIQLDRLGSERVPHDPPRLAQAIVNVVANAVDAAASGGGNVWLRTHSDERHVCVMVEDDGPGVAEEIRDQVFEPFTTTKPHGQGTGLGLAITHQILLDHGGSVVLEGRDGGGTRAELCLPFLDLSALRILVVEADPAVRRALAADLRRARFEVMSAGTLTEARSILKAHEIQVALTEVRLPDASGSELLAALRNARPEVRILDVSGEALLGEVDEADLALEKPWDRDGLVSAVRQLCIGTEGAPTSRRF